MRTTAPDGTVIATADAGAGPPIVLVGGSTYDAAAMAGLVASLADSFACFAVDRRGRGASGDGEEFAIEREYEDIAAVIAAVGRPVTLLGHSYGALCALGAMRLGADIERLVLYEPPLPLDRATMQQARALLDQGSPRDALLVFLREVVKLPTEELGFVASLPDEWFATFAPTAIREAEAVGGELDLGPKRYANVDVATLLLLGTDSPPNVASATRELAHAISTSRVAMLEGQAHNAILAAPDLVAVEIRKFAIQAADSQDLDADRDW